VQTAAFIRENGPGCRHNGHAKGFSAEQLRALYKGADDCVTQIQASMDAFVARRALTLEDGTRVVEEAKRANIH
jgi:predicted glutamine amidotransferase